MIRNLTIRNPSFINSIAILPDLIPLSNWTSVLIGENGAKKSFILRALCEAAFGSRSFKPGRKGSTVGISVDKTDSFSRVIAISGTPLDRFPRLGTTNIGNRKTKSKRANYIYLGQRAENGMAGVSQSEKGLVGALISNRNRIKQNKEILTEVFAQLGLRPYIAIRLKLASKDHDIVSLLASKSITPLRNIFVDRLSTLSSEVESSHSFGVLRASDVRQFAQRLTNLHELKRVRTLLAEMTEGVVMLRFTVQSVVAKAMTLAVADWEALIRLGVVEIEGTSFMPLEASSGLRPRIDGEHLSSGQWSWLGNFVGLAVEVRDNSLILVDEPENSLHPAWQRKFVSTLEKIVDRSENCQIVIATHSPLIASGVSPRSGNVRSLVKSESVNGIQTIESVEKTVTYGWSTDDVYDENFGVRNTRATEFVERTNLALSYIARDSFPSLKTLDKLIFDLQLDSIGLPPLDPMRVIVEDALSGLVRARSKNKISNVENRKQ